MKVVLFSTLLFVAIVAVMGLSPATPLAPGNKTEIDILLDGSNWTVVSGNRSVQMNNVCQVPGDVYTCMMWNGKLGDPYYRYNDLVYRWIAYDNWTYITTATLYPSQQTGKKCELVLDGVQAISNVFVNNVLVGSTFDQFQQYRFDVTKLLCTRSSKSIQFQIKVALLSSVIYGKMQHDAYKLQPMPIMPPTMVGLPYRNFVRTEPSSFGWDWGPGFAPQGIYKSVHIKVYNEDAVASTALSVDHIVPHVFPIPFNRTVPKPLTNDNNEFLVKFYIYVRVFSASVTKFNVSVAGSPTLHNARNSTEVEVAQNMTLKIDLRVKDVALWWPVGYGTPTRHSVTVRIEARGEVIAEETIFIGIRSTEMVTFDDPLKYRPTPTPPTPLPYNVSDRPVVFFRINGVPIFAKGANLIPWDAFQARVNDTVMLNSLQSALDANMNMVRVWGGGIFPMTSFYEMADLMGIMVWQEMIFACSQYPIDEPFLQKVRDEIRYQLRRLGRHPSIVLWSGNNENGIYDKGPGSPYEILDYSNVLETIIEEDTSRPIWPSSPASGFNLGVTPSGLPAGTQEHPLPFRVGGNSSDTHYYNYFSCPNVTLYPQTNFGSEYGFQSLPLFKVFKDVSIPEDWSLFSPLMNHRQHHPDGNPQIAALLQQNFRVPDLNSTALDVFRRVIYLSQLQQLLCVADEGSYYRRGRNMPYRTMGSLYWQLNQNWQAPSWTSMEYGGEWKLLHYAMRKVYATLHGSSFLNDTTGDIVGHIASDNLGDIHGLHVKVELLPLKMVDGNANYTVAYVDVGVVPALSGVFFYTQNEENLLKKYKTRCPRGVSSCFMQFTILNDDNEQLQTWSFWLGAVKDLDLEPTANVTVTMLSVAKFEAQFTIASTPGSAIPYVALQSDNHYGRFSDNVFTLIPGRTVRVVFTVMVGQDGVRHPLSGFEEFTSGLRIDFLNQMWSV